MPQKIEQEIETTARRENGRVDAAGLKKLDKNQKISLGFLIFFGMVVMVLSYFQMKKTIYAPFAAPKTKDTESAQISDNPNLTTNTQDLHNKDTDHDGISDWDEINIYNTSPYLEDTDSDGFTDLEEVKNGTDPNCAQGKDCSATALSSSSSEAPKTNISSQTSGTPTISSGTATSSLSTTEEQVLQDVLAGKSDPKTIRQLLLDAGMDKKQLDQISDEDLLKSYQETLKSQDSSQGSAQ